VLNQQFEGPMHKQHNLRTVTLVTLTDSTLKLLKDDDTNTGVYWQHMLN